MALTHEHQFGPIESILQWRGLRRILTVYRDCTSAGCTGGLCASRQLKSEDSAEAIERELLRELEGAVNGAGA